MQRRDLLAASAASALAATGLDAQAAPRKVLRLPLVSPETSFDPVQTNSDLNSATILAHIFEAPLAYDYLARFKNAELDAIYDRMEALPDGPERLELFRQAKVIAVAYAPYKNTVHRISTDMLYPWVVGFRRPLFWQEWWHMVDIDESLRHAK